MQPLAANQPQTGVVASISNLTLSLSRDGTRTQVLRGVDLTITRGEIIGLVGESGSGKSVLALALMGLLPRRSQPQLSGRVQVAGVDMTRSRASDLRAVRRRELGIIFQDPMSSLNPTMRVGVQVTESAGDRDESIRLMTAVGIPDAEARFAVYPHQLSGGLRQRIMAAIAVAGAPSLIVADEPTTALDVTVQAQLLRLLSNLRDEFGCSILFITHDLAVAAQIAGRIAVLYAGRIAEIGPAPEVLQRPTHPYTVGLLHSRLSLHTPRDGKLPTLREDAALAADRLAGCAYHGRCPLADTRCATEQPPLTPARAWTPAGGLAEPASLSHDRACWRTLDEVHVLDASDLDRQVPPGMSAGATAPAPSGLAVQIDDLHVRFQLNASRRGHREVHALRGIDLQVHPGEAVSIVGESGSGKTTLLRVIAGLIPPSSGTVRLGVGGAQMVFQDAGSSLTPWLTVGAMLQERLRPLKLSRTQARQRVDEALSGVGLSATVRRARPAELSGGQRQRVALARATIIAPAVLLCDEPTSSLDASLAASVLNLIREMRSRLRVTVLFVTHDLAVARLMGDRIVVMTGGEIVESGDSQSVIDAPTHLYTRRLLSAVPELGGAR